VLTRFAGLRAENGSPAALWSMERTVVLVKPDGVQRGLIGSIINRFERKGLKLCGLKMITLDDGVLDQWYAHHKDKPFFRELKKFMRSAPVVAMVWEGLEAVVAVRKIVGTTKARGAEAGTIRGDFGMSGSHNLIHASDSSQSAKKELKLIFKREELFEYQKDEYLHVYTRQERET
jgi:nucleoside-diphosphate kinase